ncbi:MAG: hypothetical protein HQL10_01750 [Nitrospirae bacterium]|nr:hypothetical protein [Nitrospirota bacterium]
MKDDFYIDIVSKTIISKLSEEIGANVGKQMAELISGMLVREITDSVAEKIKTETDLLRKTISETENLSRLNLNNSISDIKKQIDDRLERQNKPDIELQTFIKTELAGIQDALKKAASNDSLKSELSGIKEELKKAENHDALKAELSGIQDQLKKVTGQDVLKAELFAIQDALKKVASHDALKSELFGIQDVLKKVASNDALKSELSGMQDALKKIASYDSLKEILENQMTSFTGKTQALIDNLKKSTTGKTESPIDELKKYIEESFEREKGIISDQVSTIKDELAELRHVLYSYVQRLESEAAMYSSKKAEFENKIKELQEIWQRSSAASETIVNNVSKITSPGTEL